MKLNSVLLALSLAALATPVWADDRPVFTLEIKDHKFAPDTIEIPAGTKVKLLVRNLDASAEEFESYELNREVVIAGNSEGTVFLGPLDAGSYPFFGDFHQSTAQGQITVK